MFDRKFEKKNCDNNKAIYFTEPACLLNKI